MSKYFIAALAAFVLALSSMANAQSFTSADVEKFISTMTALKNFGDQYPDVKMDVNDNLSTANGLQSLLDSDGKISMFSTIAEHVMASPASGDFRKVIKDNGFASVNGFGEKADAIMMAYLALKTDQADMQQLDQMDPAMLSMMPPQVREQISAAKKMMQAVSSVPSEDIAALRPVLGQLEKAFDE
ncbi:MAG: hypothetical protein AAF603_01565 [Pseudomonadota bacterium]